MKSIFLVFLAGCSVTDDPALTHADPVSWTSRLDAELGATPSGSAVSSNGDAIVAETLWDCVDGASAGVLRVDGATGESSRVDWTRGIARSALSGSDGFAALLATSTPSDPWSLRLSFREYAEDGLSFRTYEEPSVVPVAMAGDPSVFAVLRGYYRETGVSVTRAISGPDTLWETPDSAEVQQVPAQIAVTDARVVATIYRGENTWGLLRFDDRGRVARSDAFCSNHLATDDQGAVFGAAISTDGLSTLTLCRSNADGKADWTIQDAFQQNAWVAVAGIAVGADELLVTGNRYDVDTSAYVMWTRAYDLDGELLWEQEYAPPEGMMATPVSAAIGARGEMYVLGTEDLPDGQQAPLVLRYR